LRSNFQESAKLIVLEDDFFWQDQLVKLAEDRESLLYSKRDFLYGSGVWRERPVRALTQRRQESIDTVILGHSDFPLSCVDLFHLKRKIRPRRIFASNLSCGFKPATLFNARPIPLGLTNPTRESFAHTVLGNAAHFALAYDLTPSVAAQGEERLYINFTTRNAPRDRESALKIAENSAFAMIRTPEISNRGRVRYLSEIRKNGLVVCPAGNGLDTHRFYETLLMGALPVVLKHSYSDRLARHLELPCIAISSWRDLLKIDQLREKASLVRNRPFTLKALRGSHWRAEIAG